MLFRNISIVFVLFIALTSQAVRGADPLTVAKGIDREIQKRLDAAQVLPAAIADDAEFLRRVCLDLHGVIPTAERVSRFLADQSSDKRSTLVDELLANPRFGEYFADVWRKSLLSPQANEQRAQTERFTAWLAEQFNSDCRWNNISYNLLTATGKIEDNPAVAYLVEGRFPLSVTDLNDLSSRYFLGVRLNCAQCHDHPFVSWKRTDYWGMAAFFAQIQTPGRAKAVYAAGVRDDPQVTMKVMAGSDMIEGFQLHEPTFLGGKALDDDGSTPHRVALANWMTSPDNAYFARAAVNRLWWQFFGRGLVNPVDDMHLANIPSHPELLDGLAREFVASGFDLKFLCRAILNTEAYSRTSRPGDQPEQEGALFARMSIKVLTAEQLYDSLVTVVGPPAKSPNIDTRFGTRHEFTQAFSSSGDPEPMRYDRGIPHVLRMMNSPQFAGRSLSSLSTELANSGRSSDANVAYLFMSVLARRPTVVELQGLRKELIAPETSASDLYRQLAWALLMSSEFSLNH